MPRNNKKKAQLSPTILGKHLQSIPIPDEALAFALLEGELKKDKEKTNAKNDSALRPETFLGKEDLFEGLVLDERLPRPLPIPDATHYIRRLATLERERSSWEPHWHRLSDNFLPRRSRFLGRGGATNDGGELNKKIYDSTGTKAIRTLASGMQSGLTSSAMQWFRLGLQDDFLAQHENSKEWLHKSQMFMMNVFARSNLYDQVHLLYNELSTFGTGCMIIEEDDFTTIRCRTLTAGEYCVDVDAAGRVDTLYRRLRMTPRQLMQHWPDTVPRYVERMAEEDSHNWLEVLHAIEPNPEPQRPETAYNETVYDGLSERPYKSVYIMLGGEQTILEEGGYFEFPALCPRWDTTGSDIYGRSPAMDALPDMAMLQRMRRDGLKALALEVNPPLNIARASQGAVPNVTPGAINYISPLAQGQPAITPLYQVKSNLSALQVWVEGYQRQLREALFSDLFTMLSDTTKQMTAAEVAERNSEKMLQLGPTLDRLRSELYQPLIYRVHSIMTRRDELPSPPSKIGNKQLKVEFISILAQAQQSKGIAAIYRMVQFTTGLAAAYPTALDKLNSDEAIEQMAEMYGTPPGLINSDEKVEEIRTGRAQQQTQSHQLGTLAQGMGMVGEAAKAAKNAGLSLENMDEDTASQMAEAINPEQLKQMMGANNG